MSFLYDSDGNRVEKTVGTGPTAKTTRFLIDAANGTDYTQVRREKTATGEAPPPAAFLETTRYVIGDDVLAQVRSDLPGAPGVPTLSQYHYDGLGTTRALTGPDGDATDATSYYGFGETLAQSGTTPITLLFTGEQYDPNLGFYHLRARYYDPSSGRFASLDPFVGDPMTPMSLHKYLYAHASPSGAIDPSGNITLIEVGAVAAVVGVFAFSPSLLNRAVDLGRQRLLVKCIRVLDTDAAAPITTRRGSSWTYRTRQWLRDADVPTDLLSAGIHATIEGRMKQVVDIFRPYGIDVIFSITDINRQDWLSMGSGDYWGELTTACSELYEKEALPHIIFGNDRSGSLSLPGWTSVWGHASFIPRDTEAHFIAHELMHILLLQGGGLSHTSDPANLMYPEDPGTRMKEYQVNEAKWNILQHGWNGYATDE